MLKKVFIVFTVILAGLLTGYYSQPLYSYFWPATELGSGAVIKDLVGSKTELADSESFIAKGEAIQSVKDHPYIQKLIRVSELDNTELVFNIEQEPGEDYPIWLVEVKERYPDKVPDTLYFQVDAVSGNVLSLNETELKIDGLTLDMTRQQVEKIQGKPNKNTKSVDKVTNQTTRVFNYPGLEVVFDGKGKVISIASGREEYLGPRGVKVGDAKKDVIRDFGKAATTRTNVLIYNITVETGKGLMIKFSGDEKVTELIIGQNLY